MITSAIENTRELASTSRANILMVDDLPENLLALEAILEPLDCRLIRAKSGAEALRCLLTEDVALILMDAQMPGLDGFETARLIKEREKTRYIPIIFVTAISKEQHYIFRGYSAGAVDYIAKPFDPDILKSKVRVFVELFQKNEQVRLQAELIRENEQRELERQRIERELEMERRHMAELAQSETDLSRFKATLDATLDCVRMFDPETLHYTYVNQGTLNQLGYSYDEMMQLSPVDIAVDRDETEFRGRLASLLNGTEASLRYETLHRRKDGTTVPVEVSVQFIAAPGERGRFISIVRDITERIEAHASLVQAKETAEEANRAKSDFISSISHELRTPLNAIIGFSKLLFNPRVGTLNETQEAYLQDVVQSAEHLLQIINDILDISKIEAGKMRLDLSAFSLVDLLQQSLTVVREKANAHNLNLQLDISQEVQEMGPIKGDQRKIKQVMFNLLSNAVKFTPDSGIITIRAIQGDAEKGFENSVIISVADTGIGVAPEHVERIFGAFEQVDSSYTRQQQGTGLGLPLTKRIVELHGGRLWMESELGAGSTFTFSLPTENEAREESSGLSPGQSNTELVPVQHDGGADNRYRKSAEKAVTI